MMALSSSFNGKRNYGHVHTWPKILGRMSPINGRVDRASAAEAVDSGSIPGRVKPKTIIIGIHSFPA